MTQIKVLIYSGTGAITSCVNGVKNRLAECNSGSLVKGYTFSVSTSTSITSSKLSGYDVVVFPGGTGKTYINNVSSTVVKNFVKAGGGYIGICAGAYAGLKHVDSYYDGWGVAPHYYGKACSHEGTLPVTMSSYGKTFFGQSTANMAHYNGPLMYKKTSGGGVTQATFTDNSITGGKGYAAIIYDTYGKGRTMLSSVHPELTPTFPKFVGRMVRFVSQK